MTEPMELQLRGAFAARVESLAPEREERLCAFDYGSRRHAVQRLWALGGAGAALVVAAATAAALLLTSGASVAFAGWTPIPRTAGPSAVTSARRACGSVTAASVLASEARGPYTAIVFVKDGRAAECVVEGSRVIASLSTLYPLAVYAAAHPDKVMLPQIVERTFGRTTVLLRRLNQSYQSTASNGFANYRRENAILNRISAVQTGPGSASIAVGIAGADVTGVQFILRDGHRVKATVEHGWYVAWWPGAAKPGGAEVTRVGVTTASGTHASKLPPPPRLGTYHPLKCSPGDACSVLEPLTLAPVIAPILTEHFAMFSDTRPMKPSAVPNVLNDVGMLGNSQIRAIKTGRNLGLDPDQARSVKLGPKITFWFVPGSEGTCQTRIDPHGPDGGSCGPVTSPLSYGVIDAPGTVTIHGVTKWVIGGWVPNGNKTISILTSGGGWHIVPVRNNSFVAYLNSSPASVRFRTGFGRLVTRVAPLPNEI